MPSDNRIVNAFECDLLRRVNRLQANLFAFDHMRGADFTRSVAQSWKGDRPWADLAGACWALSVELENIVGSYSLWEQARNLGVAFAAAQETREKGNGSEEPARVKNNASHFTPASRY